jgi:bifunctional non-homologous end joining protein LigD
MAKKSQWVQLGKRKVELSNLSKVLYPEDSVIKAEVVEYYNTVAPTMLNHIKGRPLTLIRYPDGIHGESFYQKNRPDWAPDWLEFVSLGSEEKKDYILATEPASLIWLANLASLEIHQMHCTKPAFDHPDYMVFDLDPPEGYDFKKLIPIALNLRDHIAEHGYYPFVKTTGGKGLHLIVPVEPRWDFSTVFEAASLIAKPFVEQYSKETTLQIKKDSRHGRVLIDIYRNRNGQSIISPYSLRGREGAPVSMPVPWEELEGIESSKAFTIHSVIQKLKQEGDAWEGIGAYKVDLHTHRKKTSKGKKLPPSPHRKTAEQLAGYKGKRDFSKSPEPAGEILPGDGNGFVVHRHHASNIHYDLRLEQDGVLKSWAVPKGLPPYPGIKRLAVQTEDHPLAYLNFEGTIPKDQYGGGDMWIYALGRYEITKLKKDGGFYFKLNSKALTGEYRMYKIKEKEWLLERVDQSQVDWLHDPVEFMLATLSKEIPTREDYFFEVKWDGIRAMITLDEGNIKIRSRNQHDITAQFPELTLPEKSVRATCGTFDVEIVCLDKTGKPDFKKVINRLQASGVSTIEKMRRSTPVYGYLFDCLYLDGRSLVNEPLWRRREWLNDIIRKDTSYRLSEIVTDGEALFQAAKHHELEGIMAKDKSSRYLPGKRSDSWLKIKVRNTADCVIIGYTHGKGNRNITFGSLHVAEQTEKGLQYRGKVGTGFDDKLLKEITASLKGLEEVKKPLKEKVMDEKITTWVEPNLFAEISYSSITRDKMFREPVFVRLRPDLQA